MFNPWLFFTRFCTRVEVNCQLEVVPEKMQGGPELLFFVNNKAERMGCSGASLPPSAAPPHTVPSCPRASQWDRFSLGSSLEGAGVSCFWVFLTELGKCFC